MGYMATREGYGKALVEFGADSRIVVMDADLSGSTKTGDFRKVYPDRFFDMGIAEGNMVATAAGIATCGKIVFCSSFAMFASERACEQVRNSVCYTNLDVKICATHAGLTVGEDGATHQCLEDMAIMRSIPNIRVVCPADCASTRLAIKAAIDNHGPFYIRLGRSKVPAIYGDDTEFVLGRANQLRDGKDLTIIACGIMVSAALKACDILSGKGISARVLDMHTIKPLDKDAVARAAAQTGLIVTAEEHSVNGGLGGAVCEAVCESSSPCRVIRAGVNDRFGKSGTPDALLNEYGLTAEALADRCEKELNASR